MDAELDYAIVPVDVTLDLGGNKFTADYLASYGDVVDYSEANDGLLVVPAGQIYLHKDNEQLPMRAGNGYKFFEVEKFNKKFDGSKYYFQPVVEKAAHELMKQGAVESGVTVNVRISWSVEDGLRYQDFVYNDSFVKSFVNSYKEETNTYGKMFTLSLSGAAAYENLTYGPVLVSDTGVEITIR